MICYRYLHQYLQRHCAVAMFWLWTMTRSSGADVRNKVDQHTHSGITEVHLIDLLEEISALCILQHFLCPDFVLWRRMR